MENLLDINQTAEYLKMKVPTLRGWIRDNTGPPYYRIGGAIRYRKTDLDQWIDSQKVETAVANEA